MKSTSTTNLLRGIALLPLGLTACAQASVDLDLERTTELTAEAAGFDVILDPGAEALEESHLRAALADGLGLEEALQMTLQNNKELQADLLEVGLAQADLVQAGLLTNPSLDLAIRFPGDGTGNLIDALLGFQLLELWQVPMRERAADYHLQATIAGVARDAAGYLRRTRQAYLQVQWADRVLQLREAQLDLAKSLRMAQQELVAQGMAEAASVDVASLRMQQGRLVVDAAMSQREGSAQELALALSLSLGLESVALVDPWPTAKAHSMKVEELVAQAIGQRLDLQAMVFKVETLEAELALRQRERFGALSAGPNFEDPGSGDPSIGPAFSWTIPLFDRNQAGIAKADFALQQARLQLAGAEARVAQDVRSAWSRVLESESRQRRLNDEVLPLARSMEARMADAVALGAASRLDLLQAHDEVLEAQVGLLRAENDLLRAQMELEWAVGVPLFQKD